MDTSIGQRIKERRKKMNISGSQLKDITGISTGNLSQIENGKVLPSSSALIELSKTLQCSVDYLLFGSTSILEQKRSSKIEEDELEMLEHFRELTVEDKEEIQLMIDMKYNRLKRAELRREISSSSAQKTNTEIA